MLFFMEWDMNFKIKITIVIPFIILLIIILLNNYLFSNKEILDTLIKIAPSNILILYRYGFFMKFLLLSGFFFFGIVSLLIGLSLFIVILIKNRKNIVQFKLILIFIFLLAVVPSLILSYRWIQSRLHFAEGYKSYQLRQDLKSIAHYQKSIRFAPTFLEPYLELITLFKNNRNYQEAIKVGKEFLKYRYDFKILEFLGDLSFITEEYNDSKNFYQLALELKKSSQIDYKLAKTYFKISGYRQCNQICLNYPSKSKFLLLHAKCLLELNKPDEALEKISSALALDNSNPEIWFLQGKIFNALNKFQKALEYMKHAIWLKKEYPEVYYEMGQIYLSNNLLNTSVECLEKAFYYENTMSDIYVQLQLMKLGKIILLKGIERNPKIVIEPEYSELIIEKNKSIDFKVHLQKPISLNHTKLECIEPYGWGVICRLMEIKEEKNNRYTAHYRITGKRDCSVNCGNPWKINFVVYDDKSGDYNNCILNVRVNDNDEGKVMFLITEDFECSEGPHKNDDTPNRSDLSVEETEIDLIKKGIMADSIANSYGIKWSHIADLGSSFLRLKWLANISQDSGWLRIWHSIKNYYINSVVSGNDVQLHIHSYNIPGAQNFTQGYDIKSNQLVFDVRKYRLTTPFPDGHFGAWANSYTDLGYFDNSLSRIGSLFQGLFSYENLMHISNPDYRILFFRAGEWEFGQDEVEMRKSVIALRKNKILAGSDAYKGRYGQKNFIFNRRVGENVYFCSFDNIRKPAQSLLNIGILQILPIPELHHYSHVRPIDNSLSVKETYNLCLNKTGKIKPGVHMLVEMYHINRINFNDRNWDSMDIQYRDWKKLKMHFEELSNYATKINFVKISQAIIEYLDYYTPDIIALRVNEQKIDNKTYMHDIKFIGKDILIDKTHPHYVSVKPPSYMVNSIKEIVLFHNKRKIKSWKNITTYEDLEFISNTRYGYKLRVKVNF